MDKLKKLKALVGSPVTVEIQLTFNHDVGASFTSKGVLAVIDNSDCFNLEGENIYFIPEVVRHVNGNVIII